MKCYVVRGGLKASTDTYIKYYYVSRVFLYVHVIWATRNRTPFLNSEIKDLLIKHIHIYSKKTGVRLECIGGHIDHLHCLIMLKSKQSVSKIVNLLKGESSHWINTDLETDIYFEWQEEYYAESVSLSHVEKVRTNIAMQDIYHQKNEIEDEIKWLIQKKKKWP